MNFVDKKVKEKFFEKTYREFTEGGKLILQKNDTIREFKKATLDWRRKNALIKKDIQGFILQDGTPVLKEGSESHLDLLPKIYRKLGIQGEQTILYAVTKAELIMIDTNEITQTVILIIPPKVTKNQIISLHDSFELQNGWEFKWDRGSVNIFLTYYDKAEEKVKEEEDLNVAATRFESIIRRMLNGQLGDEERRKIERLLKFVNFTTSPPGLMDQRNNLGGVEQGQK